MRKPHKDITPQKFATISYIILYGFINISHDYEHASTISLWSQFVLYFHKK